LFAELFGVGGAAFACGLGECALNVSKTFVAAGWAKLWTMTWVRVDHRGLG
jgi:hypothetical protein